MAGTGAVLYRIEYKDKVYVRILLISFNIGFILIVFSYSETLIFNVLEYGFSEFCDRIVVLDKEIVAEIGTFDELMSKKDKYYDFYQKQAQYFYE